MARVYTTPEGLIVTEKVHIKTFGDVMSEKLLEHENSLGVQLSDIACAMGPQPTAKVGGPHDEKMAFDPDKIDLDDASDDVIEKLIDDTKPGIRQDTSRFQVEMSLVPADVQLETLRLRKERTKDNDCKLDLKYGNALFQGSTQYNLTSMNDLVPGKTVVVTFRIYWPFRPLKARNGPEPRFSQEIVILGHQTLNVLRDVITCVADTAIPGELSNRLNSLPNETAKDVYRSGFFFIGDTFYNDFRHPDNLDYSGVIREWAESKRLGPYRTTAMESTRVEDLTVQLGYPYVYQHQANCEHLLTVSDLRLLNGTEDRSSDGYPHVRFSSNRRMKYCMMCGKFPSTWVTEENSRVPYDPFYFCDYCFRSFNYVDGKKVGKFKAYSYRDAILFG